MPNHVHILIKPLHKIDDIPYSLAEILKIVKGQTAVEANRILGRNGPFWQAERYDHFIRNVEEFTGIVQYIINNPVEADLCEHYKDWKYTWIKDDVARNLFRFRK